MNKFLLIALLAAASALPVAAQTKATDMRFRLAESYEQSGDYETAVKIYESLYARDSSNMVIFECLRRDYLQLKRYDDAISLLQSLIHRMPDNTNLLSLLASVYMLKSDEPKADSIWEKAIAVDPKHETTYRFVGSSMVQ